VKARLTLFLLATLAALFTAACGAGSSATPQAAGPARETSVQLSWFHDVEFIGIYEAMRNNRFAAQSLTVRIDGGGFDADGNYIDPVSKVMDGSAEFGVAGADVILRAREAGQPVVAVASIYQRSPVALFSLASANILRPEDLVGKRVGTQPKTLTVGIMFEALLASKNLTTDQITSVSDINFGNVDALFNGDVDVMQGFLTNQVIQARLRDSDINVMLMSDYGIDFYSNVIFTTEATLQAKPEVVQAFVTATIQGLNDSLASPDAATGSALDLYIAPNSPDPLVRQVQLEGMLASVPLINPQGSRPGLMTQEVWDYINGVLVEQQLLAQPQDVSQAFTLTFANQAYAGS
jgi:ABC-type nitrate/sulfonate/bicarbonate transport system substrate-binding protein